MFGDDACRPVSGLLQDDRQRQVRAFRGAPSCRDSTRSIRLSRQTIGRLPDALSTGLLPRAARRHAARPGDPGLGQ